jgi:PST family polysaccharide transporter
MTYAKILGYFARNLDYIVLGWFFNASILGQYSVAYKLMMVPIKNISAKVSYISLPLLAKKYRAGQNLTIPLRKLIFGLSLFTMPLMLMISATSDVWTVVFFTESYDKISSIIFVLCILGGFQGVVATLGNLFIISDKVRIMLYVNIIQTFVLGIGFYFGAATNNIDIFLNIYMLVYVFICMPIVIYSSLYVIGVRVRDIFTIDVYKIWILSFIIMLTVIFSTPFVSDLVKDPLLILGVLVFGGFIMYLLLLKFLVNSKIYGNFSNLYDVLSKSKGLR